MALTLGNTARSAACDVAVDASGAESTVVQVDAASVVRVPRPRPLRLMPRQAPPAVLASISDVAASQTDVIACSVAPIAIPVAPAPGSPPVPASTLRAAPDVVSTDPPPEPVQPVLSPIGAKGAGAATSHSDNVCCSVACGAAALEASSPHRDTAAAVSLRTRHARESARLRAPQRAFRAAR